jgi:putative acyl-CoA dehydrogenase
MSERAEREPPRHVPYDAWGRRVDRVEVSDAWRALDRVAAEEGLVAIGYERRTGPTRASTRWPRSTLFHPSSATYSCPLAMTDGAARCLELYGAATRRSRRRARGSRRATPSASGRPASG